MVFVPSRYLPVNLCHHIYPRWVSQAPPEIHHRRLHRHRDYNLCTHSHTHALRNDRDDDGARVRGHGHVYDRGAHSHADDRGHGYLGGRGRGHDHNHHAIPHGMHVVHRRCQSPLPPFLSHPPYLAELHQCHPRDTARSVQIPRTRPHRTTLCHYHSSYLRPDFVHSHRLDRHGVLRYNRCHQPRRLHLVHVPDLLGFRLCFHRGRCRTYNVLHLAHPFQPVGAHHC
mmetsp:Transcript_53916/g.86286  ORF Transcript_53916/g.86286 Transcript_53916/m.86286 type:complete len:227 (-) Transcript_53916:691-1371(-)